MKFFNWIYRKQIDITLDTFEEPCQRLSVLFGCIHTINQNIFKTNIPSGSFKIFPFFGSKISFKTKYTACAESTSHCTANLCGYACSNLSAFSQQDALNHILIRQMNEKFFSNI